MREREIYSNDNRPIFRRGNPSLRRPFRTLILWEIAVVGVIIVMIGGLIVPEISTPPPCTAHSSKPVTLTMYYDPETQAWIKDVVTDFNDRRMKACDGPITVQATAMDSQQAMQDLLSEPARPDIWTPASKVWLTLLNSDWQTKHHGQQLIGTGDNDTPSLLTSPLVIVMWQSEAKALGWPEKPLGWSDIAKLSGNGWGAYGHSELGSFKFAHAHPDYSNSGLETLMAMNYAAKNKLTSLTLNDVTSAPNKNFVSTVESSVIYYGTDPSFLADQMFTNGPGYLSAITLNENQLFQMNDGTTSPHPASPVVAIYPKEGTFSSDYPYALLNANWVTPAKKAASLVFSNFLLAADQQKKALHYGFRPSNLNVLNASSISSIHGVDFKQSSKTFQLPNASVVSAIQSSWEAERPHVDVMLLLDNSGSMNRSIGNTTKKAGSTKIDSAKSGLKEFVNLFLDNDNLGFTVFSTEATVETPVTQLGPKRKNLLDTIRKVTAPALSWTLLFDTIAAQRKALQIMPAKDIKALVVLTDGQDNSSDLTRDQLVHLVSLTGKDAASGVKIFTIAYGSDADQITLGKIATAAGGKEYTSNQQDIQALYTTIGELLGGIQKSNPL